MDEKYFLIPNLAFDKNTKNFTLHNQFIFIFNDIIKSNSSVSTTSTKLTK